MDGNPKASKSMGWRWHLFVPICNEVCHRNICVTRASFTLLYPQDDLHLRGILYPLMTLKLVEFYQNYISVKATPCHHRCQSYLVCMISCHLRTLATCANIFLQMRIFGGMCKKTFFGSNMCLNRQHTCISFWDNHQDEENTETIFHPKLDVQEDIIWGNTCRRLMEAVSTSRHQLKMDVWQARRRLKTGTKERQKG